MDDTTMARVRVEKDLILQFSQSIAGHQRDESAVPSYTHYNRLVRWIMFRRLELILEFVDQFISYSGAPARRVGLECACGVGLLLPAPATRLERVSPAHISLAGGRETGR